MVNSRDKEFMAPHTHSTHKCIESDSRSNIQVQKNIRYLFFSFSCQCGLTQKCARYSSSRRRKKKNSGKHQSHFLMCCFVNDWVYWLGLLSVRLFLLSLPQSSNISSCKMSRLMQMHSLRAILPQPWKNFIHRGINNRNIFFFFVPLLKC